MHKKDTIEFPEDGPEAEFRRALAQGEFRLQQCTDCTKYVYKPRIICPHCGSNQLEWREPSGKGTVYSTSVPHQKPELGGNYNISLIDLSEGPRMLSRVVDIAPEEVKIGMPVTAFVGELDGNPIVLFRQDGGI